MNGHYDKYLLFIKNSDEIFEFKDFLCTYIHLRYYSIIQYFQYLLIDNGYYKNQKNINESRIDGIGSHNFILNEITRYFVESNDTILSLYEIQDFEMNFGKLKTHRIKADYWDLSMIGFSDSDREKIRTEFNDFLEVIKKL